MVRFGLGCKPSPMTKLGLGQPVHLLGVEELPREANIDLPPALDQGATSSCTGNASAVAICQAMTEQAGLPKGEWVELPSRLFLYYLARAEEGDTRLDDGAMLADIFDGAARLGVPPESAWTFSEDLAKICSQPDWSAFREAADQKVIRGIKGAWRITSTGPSRSHDVAAAIAAGNPVTWGTLLDDPFFDLKPTDVWPGVTKTARGGHAVVLKAYRTNSEGQREFQLQNSWGPEWCDGGSCWISEAAVLAPTSHDLWIVASAPAYSGDTPL